MSDSPEMANHSRTDEQRFRAMHYYARPDDAVERVFHLERELSAAQAEIERLRVWVCHNGGVLNEWGREWNPAKHPPLTDYIRQRLDAAIDKERQK